MSLEAGKKRRKWLRANLKKLYSQGELRGRRHLSKRSILKHSSLIFYTKLLENIAYVLFYTFS